MTDREFLYVLLGFVQAAKNTELEALIKDQIANGAPPAKTKLPPGGAGLHALAR